MKTLNKKNIVFMMFMSLLLLSQPADASFGQSQSEIKAKGQSLKEQVENFDPQAEIEKYPHTIEVNIPDEFVTKDYTLEQFGVKDTLEIGEFRAYTESQFAKSLAQYQGLYNNKKSELMTKYTTNSNAVKKSEANDISKYASTLLNLKNDYKSSSASLENQFNQEVNNLQNENKKDNATASKDLESEYNKQIAELNKKYPNDGLKYWNESDYQTSKSEYNTIQKEIDATNKAVEQQSKAIQSQIKDAQSFYTTVEKNMDNNKNMNLKDKLDEIAPGFLESYEFPEYNPIDLDNLPSDNYQLPSFEEMKSKLPKVNISELVNDMFDLINSPDFQKITQQ